MDVLKHVHLITGIITLSITVFFSCSSPMQDKKIRRIEYHNLSGKVENAKAAEIFKTRSGLSKVENFDSLGNLVRENGFDRDMNEDNVIEMKFSETNKIIEKLTFKNFHNQPNTKTYLSKYIYKDGLLVEILWYYGTFDTTGFFARNTLSYNQKMQKIRDEYIEYNDNGGKETRIYNWKDNYRYIEDRLDKEGHLSERHFIQLNTKGSKSEHKMNFAPSSNDDTSFPIIFEYTFDRFGNELTRTKKINGRPAEITEYVYRYEGSNWTYRVFYSNGNVMWTQFRRIEYY